MKFTLVETLGENQRSSESADTNDTTQQSVTSDGDNTITPTDTDKELDIMSIKKGINAKFIET